MSIRRKACCRNSASPCRKAASLTRRKKPRRSRKGSAVPVYVVKAQIHAGGRGAGHFADNPSGKGGVRVVKSTRGCRQGRRRDARPCAGDQADRPQGPRGQAHLCRGRLRHQARALSRHADRPQDLAHHHDGLDRRRHGDRGGRGASTRRRSSASPSIPATGMQGFHARELAFGLGPRGQAGRARATKFMLGMYKAFTSLDASIVEINPLVVTGAGEVHRARRQDEFRRQRALPPSGRRRDAR